MLRIDILVWIHDGKSEDFDPEFPRHPESAEKELCAEEHRCDRIHAYDGNGLGFDAVGKNIQGITKIPNPNPNTIHPITKHSPKLTPQSIFQHHVDELNHYIKILSPSFLRIQCFLASFRHLFKITNNYNIYIHNGTKTFIQCFRQSSC